MATLGTGSQASPIVLGSLWELEQTLPAYSRSAGAGLATQVAAGRRLQVLDRPLHQPPEAEPAEAASSRLRVRLLEDGYPCWLETADLRRVGRPAAHPSLPRLDRVVIAARLDRVLAFAEAAMAQPNVYLWGGTVAPDYDCSGLMQAAFAASGIWLPRDAYLQERFCQPVAVRPGETSLLLPGDLIFFGTPRRCTHVGLCLGGGSYLHSSGREHGRNGIGIDDLHPRNADPVACHYRAELRGAGRVMHSHDGSPLPP
jgi:cell wall-associated NlpC family hydrolase